MERVEREKGQRRNSNEKSIGREGEEREALTTPTPTPPDPRGFLSDFDAAAGVPFGLQRGCV